MIYILNECIVWQVIYADLFTNVIDVWNAFLLEEITSNGQSIF
jgi:hypothetical protein